MDFARLKLLRKNKHATQAEIAALLGVTVRHYQDIEYGKIDLPVSKVIALADFFDVSTDYLLGRTDDPTRR